MLTLRQSFKTRLYNHQAVAAEKLLRPRVGALFMEMGTGKTLTALELVRRRLDRLSNVIYVCPVSLFDTVVAEIVQHTDFSYYRFDNSTSAGNVPEALIYLVGIESLSSSVRCIAAIQSLVMPDSFAIVDESTTIKNHRAKRTNRVCNVLGECKYRLIMTGAAVTRDISDLYSQMLFLSPKILGYSSFYSFAANHLEYSKFNPRRVIRSHNHAYLAAKMSPYIYQVQKEDCLDLPPKTYSVRRFCMSSEQRRCYEEWKVQCFGDWETMSEDISVYRLFTGLQRIVCGYHVDDNGDKKDLPNPRLDCLISTIAEMSAEKVIIWCKYMYDVIQIKAALDDKCFELSGRKKEVDMFRKEGRFLVGILGTGTRGLNLQFADTAIYYSSTFDYDKRIQSEDRIHRLGQIKPCLYVDLVCQKSIDEQINKCLMGKESLLRSFRRHLHQANTKDGRKKLIGSL